MFAIFNGLLIVFDYVMCVLLVFPALCLYDNWLLLGGNRCISYHCCHRLEGEQTEHHDSGADGEEQEEKQSLIRRLLTGFFEILHRFRWAIVVVIISVFVLSTIVATHLELPNSSEVRLLNDGNEYETNNEWRTKLLSEVLSKKGGSQGYVVWGVEPADTGNHNNPGTF
jgi:hypothetical protein